MGYESRDNGTHAMACAMCKGELLAPGKDELMEDLALAGWTSVAKDDQGNPEFVCGHCAKGDFAGVRVKVQAPTPVHAGDAAVAPDGTEIGHYTQDAAAGQEVEVELAAQPQPQLPSSLDRFDAMMEGTDADDDSLGRVSAVAPAAGPAPRTPQPAAAAPTKRRAGKVAGQPPHSRSLTSPAGDNDSGGVVRPSSTPDLDDPEVRRRLDQVAAVPRGPQIDFDALRATHNIFDDLDTSWDPDAD